MARFKVEIERPLCISCESCVNICPEFWEMALDGSCETNYTEANYV